MIRAKRHWLVRAAGMLAGMALSVFAGEFSAPAAGPVAFRRDRIPVDAEMMARLSGQLTTLAGALPGTSAVERRAAAQMLALAIALDPSNAGARDCIAAYQNGRHQADEDAGRLRESQASIWRVIAWLETPDAGKHGQALAACLRDVIVISNPLHPQAAALREAGETGAWAGWVPELAAYKKRIISEPQQVEDFSSNQEFVAPKPVPLPQARVQTVLRKRNDRGESASGDFALVDLQMSAAHAASPATNPPFSLAIGSDDAGWHLTQPARMLQKLLTTYHEELPKGVRVTISGREFEQSFRTEPPPPPSAAAAVLASASVTGREPEGIIIGQIDKAGTFQLPPGFWSQLKALGPGTGQHLILPAAAASWLPSLLAMENPGFFTDYEVLLANDFKHLLDLSAKTPPAPVAAAAAKFDEIRQRAGNQELRSYLANRFVRQRLGELAQEAPYHASAAMLFTQSSGKRPTLIVRPVLVAELQTAIEPMAWLRNPDRWDFSFEDMPKIGETYELCRSKVDGLEKYVDRTDSDLMDRARATLVALRTLDRAVKARGEAYLTGQAIQSARADFIRLHRELVAELAGKSGESGESGEKP